MLEGRTKRCSPAKDGEVGASHVVPQAPNDDAYIIPLAPNDDEADPSAPPAPDLLIRFSLNLVLV